MKNTSAAVVAGAMVVLYYYGSACSVRLTEDEWRKKAAAIHERALTVDSHCDTPSEIVRMGFDIGEQHSFGQPGAGQVDLPRMKEGGLDASFFAVFTGQGERTPDGYARARGAAEEQIEAVRRQCDTYSDRVALVFSPEEAEKNERKGLRSIFLGMENGYPLGKDLGLLRYFFDRGIRYLTLCHTRDNDICDSSSDRFHPEDNGLSDFGRRVVEECNRLGIMVDVSHISDKSFADVLRVTKAPVIASHSACRALSPSHRNLTDEQLRALAANGGVLQVCFVPGYLRQGPDDPEREKALQELEKKYADLLEKGDKTAREKMHQEYREIQEKYPEEKAFVRDVVDHIDHAVRVAGINHVGIGTDFDGGGELADCRDVRDMKKITEELVRRGYSSRDIQKIWGGNIFRVMREVRKIADKK